MSNFPEPVFGHFGSCYRLPGSLASPKKRQLCSVVCEPLSGIWFASCILYDDKSIKFQIARELQKTLTDYF